MLRLYKSGRHFWRTTINKHALFISLQHSLCFLGLTQIFLIHYNLFKSKRCLSSLPKLFLPIRRKIPSIFIQVLGHLPSNLYQEPTPINFAFTYFSRWFSSQWCYCNIYITVFSHHVASSPHLRFFIIYMLFKSYFSSQILLHSVHGTLKTHSVIDLYFYTHIKTNCVFRDS